VSQPFTQEPDAPVDPPVRESHVARKEPPRIQIEAFGHSDIGLVRDANEDCLAVLPCYRAM
jgi:hypothetical protein